MDKLRTMEAFVAIAENNGFAAAGKALGLSTSVISKQLAALEDHLGVRLLNRTTRRMSLTESGVAYLDHCRSVLEEIEEGEQALMNMNAEPRGKLRLNAPMTFGNLHLGPLLTDFMAEHPEVDVELTLEDRTVEIVAEGYDVAIRIGELEDSSLIARKLAEVEVYCVASPDYLEKHGTPKVPEDLKDHNCLLYSYLSTGNEWRFKHEDGTAHWVRVDGSLRANSGELLCAAARNGLGIVSLPEFVMICEMQSGRLTRLFEDFQLRKIGIHAVYPHSRHLSPKVRVFVDYLVERINRQSLLFAKC
ncbi:MAG: LysR family transcriptional regulator [Alphaproteobacteria bacterium]